MADKPKDKTSKQNLSDEIFQQVRAQIIHGGTGYGSPPKEHQFKKGEPSRNPKGRPKKAAPDLWLDEQPLLRAFHKNKTVKARDGDRIVEMPIDDALVQNGYNLAMKGNARFFGIVVDARRQAQEAHAREVRERNDVWGRYQAMAREAIADAKAKGEPEPEFLPHPDDIVIDWENGPRFVGPFDETSKAEMQNTIAFRGALLLQAALDERLMPLSEDDDLAKGPGTALEFAKVMNRSLPPRLRMTELHIYDEVDYYARHPLRWLLKTVYASWSKLGKRPKRGELFPPLGEGLTLLNMMITLAKGILDRSLDGISEEQMEELILENRRFASRQGWV